jgi:hypothetical protein
VDVADVAPAVTETEPPTLAAVVPDVRPANSRTPCAPDALEPALNVMLPASALVLAPVVKDTAPVAAEPPALATVVREKPLTDIVPADDTCEYDDVPVMLSVVTCVVAGVVSCPPVPTTGMRSSVSVAAAVETT